MGNLPVSVNWCDMGVMAWSVTAYYNKYRPRHPFSSPTPTYRKFPASSPPTPMKFVVLVSALLLPVVSLAHSPSPLLADDGRDLSFLLKRYDGPAPILHRATKGQRHIVPRTLQVEEVPVRRALNGLVKRQQCLDAGYVPCPGGTQCCPMGAVCGPGSCCPSGNLACTGNCQIIFLFLRFSRPLTHKSSFRLPRCPRRLLSERRVLLNWPGGRVHSSNGLVNF
jgi:hypothetical protein